MGEKGEAVAVEMAATGAVGQRLDKLDESFLMALDYMIQQADRDDKVLLWECSCIPAFSFQITSEHLVLATHTPKAWWSSLLIEKFGFNPNWEHPLLELYITICPWRICFSIIELC